MTVSQADIKRLFLKSGGICAFPGCRQELITYPTEEIVGQVCHIVGQKVDGPRGIYEMPVNDRDREDNIVLLCPTHHVIIDRDVDQFTVEVLRDMKASHENWVRDKLVIGHPIQIKLSQLNYINVPRLSVLAGMCGIEVDLSFMNSYPNLHSMEWNLINVVSSFKHLLAEIHPLVLNANDLDITNDQCIGITVWFDDNYRTRNCPGPNYLSENFQLTGNAETDPMIYRKYANFNLVMSIDPKWITTTTAFVSFRPSGGIGRHAGLCTIKDVDFDSSTIFATPLVIGLPPSLLMETLFRRQDR